MIHASPFTLEKLFYSICKSWMCKPMNGLGLNGLKATREFVFTLRTALDNVNSVGKRPFQRGVIGQFKMQAIDVFESAQ